MPAAGANLADGNGKQAVDCQACGACCAYSSDWPRFTMEDDAAIAAIPPMLVADDERGMKFEDGRCSALLGVVGCSTSCSIYDVRPDVCRACMPGDDACAIARAAFGFDPVES